MLIAQISDCHITAPGDRVADRVDPAVGLRRAIEWINGLSPTIDLVVGTGDLVNDGRPEEYDELSALLSTLGPRFLPLPGNHDDRSEIRRRFPDVPPGRPDEPIDHVVELGACRIVCLDTTIPGRHDGRLSDDQLAWLDDALGAGPDTPTIVAQHHPPVPSGIPSMDGDYGLSGAASEAEVIARHRNVVAVIGGHYHRTLSGSFGGTIASCCPSTALELALDFEVTHALYCDEPTGLLLHRIDPLGSLTSHVVSLTDSERWVPSWASPSS